MPTTGIANLCIQVQQVRLLNRQPCSSCTTCSAPQLKLDHRALVLKVLEYQSNYIELVLMAERIGLLPLPTGCPNQQHGPPDLRSAEFQK